uniref:DEP domain containing MTOR interacting protein n=2 Tax=Neognathae TaxID=8825 RepID=A0A8C2Y7J5_COTJA
MEEGMSSMQQKATELEHMAEVLLTGEQLRLRLHEEKVIKDRRHHLKTYPNCFVAKELIDWLIDHKEASDRETAIKLVQKLLDHSIIHHVCDEHKEFKDAKLFYRFRKDDGTFPLDNEVKVFMRGQRLYEKLMSSENTLLQAREEEGVKYERTFVASEFIDWLIQEGEATTRTEAEQLGRRLLEHGIIQHVSNKHHFMDSNLLYQCRMNFRRRRRLMELLTEKSRLVPESHDSPFCLRKQNHDNRKHTSFLSVSPTKEIKIVSAVRRSSMSSCGSSGYFSSSPTLSSSPPVLCNPKSVLKRPVTADELLMPGAPYVRKTFTIVGDAVGWGFVVRGSKPCHIQAVDPSGPAAAAGMKVRAQRGMLYCDVWASWGRSWAACTWTVGGTLVSWAECLSDVFIIIHFSCLPPSSCFIFSVLEVLHRITEWFGLDGSLRSASSTPLLWAAITFSRTGTPNVPYNLALKNSRGGKSSSHFSL